MTRWLWVFVVGMAACTQQGMSDEERLRIAKKSLQPLLQQSQQGVADVLQSQAGRQAWQEFDPSLSNASSFDVKSIPFGGQGQVVQVVPHIHGIPVEGGSRVFSLNAKQQLDALRVGSALEVEGKFVLATQDAIAKAYAVVGRQPPKQLQNSEKGAQKVWLHRAGIFKPAWKIIVMGGSAKQTKIVWVDAQTGDILKQQPLMRFHEVNAQLFQNAPSMSGAHEGDLQATFLQDLIQPEDQTPLVGKYIDVKNCCRFYRCLHGGQSCDPGERICAQPWEEDAIEYRVMVQENPPSDFLQQVGRSTPLFVDTVQCLELDTTRYDEATGTFVGIFDDGLPIDDGSWDSVTESFAEKQAYYSASSFFRFIQFLMDNDSWCLHENSMHCHADGSPVFSSSGLPEKPFRMSVNHVLPYMDLDSQEPSSVLSQIQQGRGDESDPVRIDDFQYIGNAAFIPAVPEDVLQYGLSFQDKLDGLLQPYDHIVFFQGDRDFAYDIDVVCHEFMHAVTHSLVPELGSMALDKWGVHVMPAALDEAWADYFAAAFTEDPHIAEYSASDENNHQPLRELDGVYKCPDDLVGESHHDAVVFSAGIWALRAWIGQNQGEAAADAWDRLVLKNLAQASSAESFDQQIGRLVANLKSHSVLGADVLEKAEEIFEERGLLTCDRIFSLAHFDENTGSMTHKSKELLYQASPSEVGLSKMAPPYLQFRVDVPPGVDSFEVVWEQTAFDQTDAWQMREVSSSQSLKAIVTHDEPLEWEVQSGEVWAYAQGESEEIQSSVIGGSDWGLKYTFESDPCLVKTFYVSLLSEADSWELRNIRARVPDSGKQGDSAFCEEQARRRQKALAQQEGLHSGDLAGGFSDGASGDGNSQSDSPKSKGCGCGSSGDGPDAAMGLLVVCTLWMRRRRSWHEVHVMC
ncbi:MAG: hypothetical protein AAF320_05455 [Myxococcota bacterium]